MIPRGSLRSAWAIARRPDLWLTAVAAGASVTPRSWWRRPPYLPLPDRRWMQFRLETAYGGDGRGPVRPQDLVNYLEWRKTV